MSIYGWKKTEKLTVADSGGTAAFVIPATGRGILEKLTIWALSGSRSMASLVFQPQINGVNFGSAVNFTGPGVLAQLVFQDVASTVTENMLLPPAGGDLLKGEGSTPADPLEFSILITNNDSDPHVITMAAAALARGG